MTRSDDRERTAKVELALEEEMMFRILARRNRLLGHWAAELMGLTQPEADAYASEVIRADFEDSGDEEVIRKLLGDLTAAGADVDEAAIREALEHKAVDARRQIIEASN